MEARLATEHGPGPNRAARARASAIGATRFVERFSVLFLLLVLIAVYSVLLPDTFAQVSTATTLLTTQSVLGLIAIAVLFPLIAGEFDLSVGAISGVAGLLTAYLVDQGLPAVLVLAAVIVAGSLVGLINGALVTVGRINSLVATLGTSVILSGVALWISDGGTINMPLDSIYDDLTSPIYLDAIPAASLYLIGFSAVAWFVLDAMAWGRLLRITGASPRAARLIGIPVDRFKLASFVIAGVIAAFSGILSASLFGSASPAQGPSLLLPAYAVAFVGSTTIFVGRFNVPGTLSALALIAVGVTGLQMLGAPTYIQPIFNGLALLVAVGVAGRTRRAMAAA
jgi:ribose transport system permease protein